MYVDPDGGCQLNQAMLALMVVVVLVLSILPPLLRNGSIFTTAMVSFYVSYLTFAGLEASDDAECNWFATHSDQLSLWMGFLVTIAAISYTGFAVSKNFVEMSDGSKSLRESAKDHSHDAEDEEAADNGGGAVFNNGGDLMIMNGTMIANNLATGAAGSGGGLFSTAGSVMISNAMFDSNSAIRAGGAIEIIDGLRGCTKCKDPILQRLRTEN